MRDNLEADQAESVEAREGFNRYFEGIQTDRTLERLLQRLAFDHKGVHSRVLFHLLESEKKKKMKKKRGEKRVSTSSFTKTGCD